MGIVSIAILVVALVVVLALGSSDVPGMRRSVLTWAGVVGGVAFAAGFVGPMVFWPESNQGPLLGIFITGPIGFVVGGVAGAVVAWRRHKRVSDWS